MYLFDTHSHIQEKEFDTSRTEVLARMREVGVCTTAVGCDYASSARAVHLAQQEDVVWACVGVHPTDTTTVFNRADFSGFIGAKKADGTHAVVAIGECGLDYARLDGLAQEEKARQRELFIQHIEYALEVNLPLMLHIRPSKGSVDAHDDALAILAAYPNARGTCHFFTSTAAVARHYLDIGFYISFSGVITFATELEDVVRSVPLDRMLLETDAPYAAPVPHRGQQNEPCFVVEGAHKIAELKAVKYEVVCRQTLENARALFAI